MRGAVLYWLEAPSLDPAEVDMFCMVMVGSSQTRRFQPVKNGPTHLFTPRGYLSRGEDPKA